MSRDYYTPAERIATALERIADVMEARARGEVAEQRVTAAKDESGWSTE